MSQLGQQVLPERDLKFLEAMATRVHQAFPEQIASLRLFGSKARGDFTQKSDIDILVLTHQEDHRLFRRVSFEVYDVALDFGVAASAKVFSQKRFDESLARGDAFATNVLDEGVEL